MVSVALSGCNSESGMNTESSAPNPDAAKAALSKMPAAPGKGGKAATNP